MYVQNDQSHQYNIQCIFTVQLVYTVHIIGDILNVEKYMNGFVQGAECRIVCCNGHSYCELSDTCFVQFEYAME